LFHSSTVYKGHYVGETDESEAASSGDVKSRLKKKAVSGLQRKDSTYCILHNDMIIIYAQATQNLFYHCNSNI